MKWRKSTFSNGENSMCVEVARTGSRQVAARDSKNPTPQLSLDQPTFARLLGEIKAGKHDLR